MKNYAIVHTVSMDANTICDKLYIIFLNKNLENNLIKKYVFVFIVQCETYLDVSTWKFMKS